jgi:large subunit ribosomal protein L21
MYAVIRAGGKQYRVAPGDVVRMEKVASGGNGQVQFDVLAVSGNEGEIGPGHDAQVTGQVVGEGRGGKILVFHYKRKKQYKKLQGHRQAFSSVRITEIAFGGQSFKAPELPAKVAKKPKAEAAAPVKTGARAGTAAKKAAAAPAKAKSAAAPKAKAAAPRKAASKSVKPKK